MIILKETARISQYISSLRQEGKRLGFVPTMGALHTGHLSLIQAARQSSDVTVCSIFVNPTQFNNAADFKHYPITLENDIKLLIENECDILFLPSVSEVYPADYKKKLYDLGSLEHILEGYYRPGHFQGVCEVVDRLLEIVNPDCLFMGQKDYQQCMVIQKLLELTGRNNLELIICPTKRETDGLAMSSRNMRLNEDERTLAINISSVLNMMKSDVDLHPFSKLKDLAKKDLESHGFLVDYVEIADAATLEPATDKTRPIVGLVAASIGNIRLIDNMTMR